jgi:hypothetical protein
MVACQIMHFYFVFDRKIPEIIGRTVHLPRFHAPTCHPHRKAVRVMIPPDLRQIPVIRNLRAGRPPELTTQITSV